MTLLRPSDAFALTHNKGKPLRLEAPGGGVLASVMRQSPFEVAGQVHLLRHDRAGAVRGLAPFVDLVDSDSAWVNHGVTALLALLIYGVGLGFLANALPKQRHHANDWRTAGS